jgi:hypothetical protein
MKSNDLWARYPRTPANNTNVRETLAKHPRRFPQNFPQPANPQFMRIYPLNPAQRAPATYLHHVYSNVTLTVAGAENRIALTNFHPLKVG